MKPNRLYYPIVLISLFLFSNCSPDQDNGIAPEPENQFTFNGETYNLISANVTDENTANNDPSEIGISLFNKTSTEVTSNQDLNDIDYIYFDFVDVTIQNTTYTQIQDYDVSINGTIVDSEFNAGTTLLSDNDPESNVYAQSGSVTVTNFTQFNIAFTFTFTRNDGEVISGSYDGPYLNPQ